MKGQTDGLKDRQVDRCMDGLQARKKRLKKEQSVYCSVVVWSRYTI